MQRKALATADDIEVLFQNQRRQREERKVEREILNKLSHLHEYEVSDSDSSPDERTINQLKVNMQKSSLVTDFS